MFGYVLKPATSDDLRVTIAVAWGRHLDCRRLAGQNQQLQVKLENRKLIEKAKGLIMANFGLVTDVQTVTNLNTLFLNELVHFTSPFADQHRFRCKRTQWKPRRASPHTPLTRRFSREPEIQ